MSLQASNQNKKLKQGLILCAVIVWGVVVYQIMHGTSSGSKFNAEASKSANILHEFDLSILNIQPIIYEPNIRDPFESYLYTKKSVIKRKATAKKAPSKPKVNVSAPKAKIIGFMGGDNPVAIIKQGENTELVKKGSQVWGFTVKKVTRTEVTVELGGETFILK